VIALASETLVPGVAARTGLLAVAAIFNVPLPSAPVAPTASAPLWSVVSPV